MSFSEIRNKCNNDKCILFTIIYWMTTINDTNINNYLLRILKLDVIKLSEIQSYKYPKSKDDQYDVTAIKYYDKELNKDSIFKLLSIGKRRKRLSSFV